jgi:hypothetical protein
MARKPVSTFCIFAVCLLTLSCKKLGPPTPTGPLTYETVKFADAIPAEYGTLVAVTAFPQTPTSVYLWFQKPDGTVTSVFVDMAEGRIHNRAMTIPRR